ncbi:MAG: Eco29kI family restriction endonuclease [Deltaproteobacteria bacterium]|jgi:hypothetical protein|nr:Eco29kI family restriction endonuclease [Deltaproteobacteria bacterium]
MDEGNSKRPLPFNPLDKSNLGESVAAALMCAEPCGLPPEHFFGAGVYALYFNGRFKPYALLSKMDHGQSKFPVYVGKAVPVGARKGLEIKNDDHGPALFRRLREHAESISAVNNLNISDFSCRLLVVDEIWIPLAEATLIRRFQPLWNCVIDGFGNHNPGKGRKEGAKSLWDILHPGRPWAAALQSRGTDVAQLAERAKAYLDVFFKNFDLSEKR